MAVASVKSFARNIPYFRQQLYALLGNTSASVKFVCVAVACGYLLSFSPTAVEVLSVTPGYLLPPTFWIWTALTHCFLEMHFWEVCADVITVGLCGKLIEPLWGTLEMMTFFALVNFGVGILSAVSYLMLYTCTSDTDLLFHIHIHGLAGYIAGVAVAVKQIMPDHIIIRTPVGKITNRNIPISVLCLSLILWIIRLLDGTYPMMFGLGLVLSWIYLRFYQRHSNGTKGDMADNFTFASFFPTVLQPPLSMVCNTVFSFFVSMRVCKKPVRKYDIGAPSSISISLPGTDPHDADRRRQIALKALSERLIKLSETQPTPQWPAEGGSPTKGVSKSVTIVVPEMPEEPIEEKK